VVVVKPLIGRLAEYRCDVEHPGLTRAIPRG
jgi:hypothetical protein